MRSTALLYTWWSFEITIKAILFEKINRKNSWNEQRSLCMCTRTHAYTHKHHPPSPKYSPESVKRDYSTWPQGRQARVLATVLQCFPKIMVSNVAYPRECCNYVMANCDWLTNLWLTSSVVWHCFPNAECWYKFVQIHTAHHEFWTPGISGLLRLRFTISFQLWRQLDLDEGN